jgi:hypothetical protein
MKSALYFADDQVRQAFVKLLSGTEIWVWMRGSRSKVTAISGNAGSTIVVINKYYSS